jgi:hypothetical protein
MYQSYARGVTKSRSREEEGGEGGEGGEEGEEGEEGEGKRKKKSARIWLLLSSGSAGKL